MVSVDIFGYIGGAIVTFSFLPQMIRIVKLKTANEISAVFTSSIFAGCLILTAYGFYMHHLPIMIFGVVNTLQSGLLIALKYIYAKNSKKYIIYNKLTVNMDTAVTLEDTQKLVEETKKPIGLVLN